MKVGREASSPSQTKGEKEINFIIFAFMKWTQTHTSIGDFKYIQTSTSNIKK